MNHPAIHTQADHSAQHLTSIKSFIEKNHLPDSFLSTAWQYYLPLALNLFQWTQKKQTQGSFILGINGAQGTGKSTMASLISTLLTEFGLEVVTLSIDDFYLTKKERQELAQKVHPLLKTRGVPGTHDIKLANQVIDELNTAPSNRKNKDLQIPRFNKAIDDRFPEGEKLPQKKVDIILLEGWCIGALPQANLTLDSPYNELELTEDPDGSWRESINQHLADDYQTLYAKIDYLAMLKAPSFEMVFKWRSEQEERLKENQSSSDQNLEIMDAEQIKRFIMHYERLTRWMLKEMPRRAQCCFFINEDHCVYEKQLNETKWISKTDRCSLLVVTDLDASLLDEQYSWDAAHASLSQLKKHQFPVIFNSSKTLAEMIPLSRKMQKQLNVEASPIVAENGGLIAYPTDDKYVISVSSVDLEVILDLAHELRKRNDYQFIGFSDMSAAQISQLTGLNSKAAAQAKNRNATEPILWQDSDENFEAFKKPLEASGIRVVRGGHFIHLMGQADKADALQKLKSFYQKQFPEQHWLAVALGDSPNDEAMLNAADFGVLIPNKKNAAFPVKAAHSIQSTYHGPKGWQEAIQNLFQSLYGIEI